MGPRDSSHTRVKPVFDTLLERDPTGKSWLPALLALPELPGIASRAIAPSPGALTDHAWGDHERGLPPPRSLLRWLVTEAVLPPDAITGGAGRTREKREALSRRDPDTIAEALTLLDKPARRNKDWYILEGTSKPDVYLATPELLVVIEGKRTETGPTPGTEWMPVRHQMLRHLDAAWEQLQPGQRLVGFFIVEGVGGATGLSVPPPWHEAAQATTSSDVLDTSLPHRTSEERAALAAAFLGVTTWQRVCTALGLDYHTLPDTYAPKVR